MGQHEQPMPAGRRRIALATGVAITALLIVLATASTSGSGRHGSFIPLGATAADAVQAVEDQLMQECLSLEQATGLLSSALTEAGIGPDDYTVRTDGGIQSRIGEFDLVLEHLAKGCHTYAGVGSDASGDWVFYVAGPGTLAAAEAEWAQEAEARR